MKIIRQFDESYKPDPGQQMEQGDIVDRIGYVDENVRIQGLIRAGEILDLVRGRWLSGTDAIPTYGDRLDHIEYQRWIVKKYENEGYEATYSAIEGKTKQQINEMIESEKQNQNQNIGVNQ